MLAAASELKRFTGLDDRSSRLYRLVWIPYATAGVFACCTAASNQITGHGAAIGLAAASPALNQTMGHRAAIGLAVASSFGAGMGLLFLPMMQCGIAPKRPSPTVYLHWSSAWGAVAAIVIAAFLFFIGPGLQ